MKRIFYCIIPLLLITLCYSCNSYNDFIVTDKRAGLLKLGQKEKQVRKLFADHQIEEFTSNVSDTEKFLTINTIDNTYLYPIQVYFRNGRVKGIKVFVGTYKTKFGLTPRTYFHVIKANWHFWYILNQSEKGIYREFKEEKGTLKMEGLKSYGPTPFFTVENKVHYIVRDEFYSWDIIESFLIGENFNFIEDTKSAEEKKQDQEKFKGKISDNEYKNDLLKLRFTIPEGWSLNENIIDFGLTAEILTLSSKNSNTVLNLTIQKETSRADFKQLHSKLESCCKPSYLKRRDLSVYRGIYSYDKKVYYTMVKNSVTFLFHGQFNSEEDLKVLDELMLAVEIN